MIPTQKRALFLLLGAASILPATAQDIATAPDSIGKGIHTEATFREAAPSRIVGGVSVVNVAENQKKDHSNASFNGF